MHTVQRRWAKGFPRGLDFSKSLLNSMHPDREKTGSGDRAAWRPLQHSPRLWRPTGSMCVAVRRRSSGGRSSNGFDFDMLLEKCFQSR